MQIKRTRNALVGSLVIALARRYLRRRFRGGDSTAVWPFFALGVLTVFAVVAWRRRHEQPGVQADAV